MRLRSMNRNHGPPTICSNSAQYRLRAYNKHSGYMQSSRTVSDGEEAQLHCRLCGGMLHQPTLDLGMSPLCNAYVPADRLDAPEVFYPLRVYVCPACWLMQLPEMASPEEIFSDYRYFSSYSDSWLNHAKQFVEDIVREEELTGDDLVVEVASNDGYLLQFAQEKGLRCVGVEPADNVAEVARQRGIDTRSVFFGRDTAADLAKDRGRAQLIVANNVLAHVPDVNDFVAGLKRLLAAEGLLTIEVPHLLRLLQGNQFDTIYHEHYSYFSLQVLQRLFTRHDLIIADVQELPTHGGSLRLKIRHTEAGQAPSAHVQKLLEEEVQFGLESTKTYKAFGDRLQKTKHALLRFLMDAREARARVLGYGAPGKATTLLTYCGIGPDLLSFTVDRSPFKQGQYMPGTRIPIRSPQALHDAAPDYVLILPWNLQTEIMEQLTDLRAAGTRFVTPVPELTVHT